MNFCAYLCHAMKAGFPIISCSSLWLISSANQQKNNKISLQGKSSERLKPLKSPAFTWSSMPSPKYGFYFHKIQELFKSPVAVYTKLTFLACKLLYNKKMPLCTKLKRMDGLSNRHDSSSYQLPQQIKLCHWGNFSAFATNRNSKFLRELIWHNSWHKTHGTIHHSKNCTQVNCFLKWLGTVLRITQNSREKKKCWKYRFWIISSASSEIYNGANKRIPQCTSPQWGHPWKFANAELFGWRVSLSKKKDINFCRCRELNGTQRGEGCYGKQQEQISGWQRQEGAWSRAMGPQWRGNPSCLLEQFSPQQQIHPFYSTAAAGALHGGENPDSAVNFFRTQ